MAKRFYSVVTTKDNFIATVVNEDALVLGKKNDNDIEPSYVAGFKSPHEVLVLTDITMLVPNGEKVGILPFKGLVFGAEFVTVPVSAISEIYFVNEQLATQARAASAGIEMPSK
jgi:hypothetical protein